MNYASLITVRVNSSRLPCKCLLPFGRENVLEHNIKRAKHFNLKPIVCTTNNKNDDVIEDICKKEGVSCFRGSEKNKLMRWRDCAINFGLDVIHTIDSDDPFFCPDEISESIKLISKFKSRNAVIYPTKTSMNGAATSGFSFSLEALEVLTSGSDNNTDTEMIDEIILSKENIEVMQLDNKLFNKKNVRMTLDYAEDYFFLSFIKSYVGYKGSRNEINSLLDKFPESMDINNFRQDDWMKNQNREKEY